MLGTFITILGLIAVGVLALFGHELTGWFSPQLMGEAKPDALRSFFLQTAGFPAIDCGEVEIRHDPSAATDCAFKAFDEKKAFYVRYDVQGIDSRVAGALVGDGKGQVYGVEYDSYGWSDEGIKKPSVLSKDRHLIITPCPAPIKLTKTKSGRLTCFPPSREYEHNLMSPNAEAY